MRVMESNLNCIILLNNFTFPVWTGMCGFPRYGGVLTGSHLIYRCLLGVEILYSRSLPSYRFSYIYFRLCTLQLVNMYSASLESVQLADKLDLSSWWTEQVFETSKVKMTCCPEDSDSVDGQKPRLRECTDVVCLWIFIFFWVLLVGIRCAMAEEHVLLSSSIIVFAFCAGFNCVFRLRVR